jgi:HD-like signal output (HDOD) protein
MIQGEIHTFPLPDLIHWLALTRRTGALIIAQGADSVERYLVRRAPVEEARQIPQLTSVQLYFVAGEIAAASMSELAVSISADKVRQMLSTALTWHAGRFAFSTNPLPNWVLTGNLRLPAEPLLQEAAAMAAQDRQAKPSFGSGSLGQRVEIKTEAEGLTVTDALRLRTVIEQTLKEDFNVPAMPQLASRVLALTQDENFSLRALENLVLTDQAVAARVLRYANSVLYGSERRVDSLNLALQRLGTDEVVNIVLAASLHARRLGHDPFAKEKRRLAPQSLVTALLVRALAARAGLNSNLGFLCGLLMDFGMTVLYSLIQQALGPRPSSEPLPMRVIEEIVVDYHPRVGRVVGERWQLPVQVIETMAYHHCLNELIADKPYVAAAALADSLASFALSVPRGQLADALEKFPPERVLAHPAAKFINLNEGGAIAALAELPRCVDRAFEFVAD